MRGGNILTRRLLELWDTARDFAARKGPVIYVENHDHSNLDKSFGRERHLVEGATPFYLPCLLRQVRYFFTTVRSLETITRLRTKEKGRVQPLGYQSKGLYRVWQMR